VPEAWNCNPLKIIENYTCNRIPPGHRKKRYTRKKEVENKEVSGYIKAGIY
jgi:hypothetical protein